MPLTYKLAIKVASDAGLMKKISIGTARAIIKRISKSLDISFEKLVVKYDIKF